MPAPESCRKHGEYLQSAHIRDDHDIEITVRRARGGDHFQTSSLIGLVHDSRAVGLFILKMTAVIEVNRHRAGRIHEYLFQCYDRVCELTETDPVEKILDRRFKGLVAYGSVITDTAADAEAEIGVRYGADIHLHESARSEDCANGILCAHGNIHASGEIVAGAGGDDAERDRAYIAEAAENVMDRSVTADCYDESVGIMSRDLSCNISRVPLVMGRIDLVGNVSFSQLFYDN